MFIDFNTQALFHTKPATLAPPTVLEAIDRDMVRASLTAGKRCRSKHKSPWSPKVTAAWAKAMLYRIAMSSHKNKIDNSKALNDLKSKANEDLQFPVTLAEAKEQYIQAKRQLKSARGSASESRREFLNDKMKESLESNTEDKSKLLKRIQRAENIKAMYKKIRQVRGTQHNSIRQLLAPSDPTADPKTWKGEWTTIDSPEEIQERIIKHNQQHFGQAEGTPLTSPYFQKRLTYLGTTSHGKEVLEGTFDPGQTTPETSLLLNHLKRQAPEGDTIPEIPVATLRRRLRKWRESTTTSPSGIHLGHYRAMVVPVRDEEIQNKQEELLNAHLTLMNLALRIGYSLKRWQKVTNVISPKDSGVPKIHRLRVIHIYEADYNLILGVLWKNTMKNAEQNKTLNPGLHGGRTGHNALDPVVQEVVQYDILKHSMKTAITKDLDAASCYDRILTRVATLASQSQGLSFQAAHLNATTLQSSKFRIQTSLGLSEESYQHTRENPIHGTGQGSGNSPIIWNFISSALFNAFQSKAHGSKYESFDRSVKVHKFMTGFVDDCSMGVNDFISHTQPIIQQLQVQMTEDAQLWCDLLWASGGRLELTKCMTYQLSTSHSVWGQSSFVLDMKPKLVELKDPGTKATIPIQNFPSFKSHKTLGLFINPEGTQTAQFKALIEKVTPHTHTINTSHLTLEEAWTYYTAVYLPSMSYPLGLTNLTPAQCYRIESSFAQGVTRRMGYHRSTSRAIRYGPARLGCLGIHRLHQEQSQSKILLFITRLRAKSQTSDLLSIALSWVQAFAGVSFSILEDVTTPLPYLPKSYFLSLRDALHRCNSHLVLEDPMIPPLLRENDRYVMDVARKSRHFTPKQIAILNRCRLFLQVITVADLADVSGERILPRYLTDNPPLKQLYLLTHSFNQQLPTSRMWSQWKSLLRILAFPNFKLRTPLGHWIVSPVQQRRDWRSYFSPSTNLLYANVIRGRAVFAQCIRTQLYKRQKFTSTVPDDVYPVLAELEQKNPRMIPATHILAKQPERDHRVTIPTDITKQPTAADYACSGDLVAASDGSVRNGTGTFGWIVTKETNTIAEGSGYAPDSNPSSFHAEACGLLSLLEWIQQFAVTTTPTRNIYILIDNQSLVTRMTAHARGHFGKINDTILASWNITQRCAGLIDKIAGEITFKWIKGHQDSKGKPVEFEATLNIAADRLANAVHDRNHDKTTICPLVPGERVQLCTEAGTISAKFKHVLRYEYTKAETFEYYAHRFDWNPTVVNIIDWNVVQDLQSVNSEHRKFFVRHMFGILPTAKYANRYNPAMSDRCPFCPAVETNRHFLQCPHNHEWRTSLIKTVDKMVHDPKHNISFPLQELIKDGIRRSFQSAQVPPHQQHPQVTQLAEQQNQIGWEEILRGKFTKQWTDRNSPSHLSIETLRDFSRLLLTAVRNAWYACNTFVHGDTLDARRSKERQAVEQEVLYLYSLRNKIHPQDRPVFLASPENHIATSTTISLQNWITTYKPLILASLKATTQSERSQRSITDWITR